MNQHTIKVIKGCERCGGEHTDTVVMPFLRCPPKNPDGTTYATHWAMCPTIGEPMLVYVIELEPAVK